MDSYTALAVILGVLSMSAGLSMCSDDNQSTLRLLFLVWRHGARGPLATYPKDPYINNTYLPNGKGNLVNKGKLQSYELGQFLRQRYGYFLGQEVTPDLMVVRSTEMPRARQTASLVMAGLFPPADSQRWGADPGLGQSWMPVDVDYEPLPQDNFLNAWDTKCPALREDYKLQMSLLEDKAFEIMNNGSLYDYVSENSGLDVHSLFQASTIHEALQGTESADLPLPDWTKKIFPEPITTLQSMNFMCKVATPLQKRLVTGPFFNEMVNNSLAYRAAQLPLDRRLYAYSAHDNLLTGILSATGTHNNQLIPSGSVIIIELRQKSSGELGFKFLFRNVTDSPPYELNLPQCGSFCAVDDFERIYSDVLLTREQQWKLCYSRILRTKPGSLVGVGTTSVAPTAPALLAILVCLALSNMVIC